MNNIVITKALLDSIVAQLSIGFIKRQSFYMALGISGCVMSEDGNFIINKDNEHVFTVHFKGHSDLLELFQQLSSSGTREEYHRRIVQIALYIDKLLE